MIYIPCFNVLTLPDVSCYFRLDYHRFGIASVVGDEIILNGTTIEEVRDYHRETLILCVEEANKKESEIKRKERERREREEMQRKKHYDNISSVAEEIEF